MTKREKGGMKSDRKQGKRLQTCHWPQNCEDEIRGRITGHAGGETGSWKKRFLESLDGVANTDSERRQGYSAPAIRGRGKKQASWWLVLLSEARPVANDKIDRFLIILQSLLSTTRSMTSAEIVKKKKFFREKRAPSASTSW